MLCSLARWYLQKYRWCSSGLALPGEHVVDVHLGLAIPWGQGQRFRECPILKPNYVLGVSSRELRPKPCAPLAFLLRALGDTRSSAAAKMFFQGSGVLLGETEGGTRAGASPCVLCKVLLEGMDWAELTLSVRCQAKCFCRKRWHLCQCQGPELASCSSSSRSRLPQLT